MRVSDDDRQRVTEVLRQAAGEGRLDLDELEERLELAWGAKTYADLVPLTVDLQPVPVAQPAPAQHAALAQAPTFSSSSAIMSECKRVGVWTVPSHSTAFALMGSITLDLRTAVLSSHEVVINANAIMGEVKVIVPAHVHVVLDGTPVMGEFTQGKDKVAPDLRPDSPVVRVKGVSLMGSVNVQRKPPAGTPKKFLGRH
jgi:hypothetical protein